MDYLASVQQENFVPLTPLLVEPLSWALVELNEPGYIVSSALPETLQLNDLLDDMRNEMPSHGDESYDVLVALMAAELTYMSVSIHQHPQKNDAVVRIG